MKQLMPFPQGSETPVTPAYEGSSQSSASHSAQVACLTFSVSSFASLSVFRTTSVFEVILDFVQSLVLLRQHPARLEYKIITAVRFRNRSDGNGLEAIHGVVRII